MMMFLRDIEIFELLGLSNFDDNQKDEYLKKMLKPILTQAVVRAIEESNLPEDKLDFILEMIDNNTDPEILQVESLKLMPNLLRIISEETYFFKKGSLLDQLNDVEKKYENSSDDEIKYMIKTIKDLRTSLEKEEEATFKSNWEVYNGQRSKLSKS